MIAYINEFDKIKILENPFCTNKNAKEKIDEYSLFNFLSVMSLALGILMAGRCDTESYKMLLSIKNTLLKRKQLKGLYGFMMAI